MGNPAMQTYAGTRSVSLDSQLRSVSLDSQLLEDAGIEEMLAEEFGLLQQSMPAQQHPLKVASQAMLTLIRTALNNGAVMDAAGDAIGCAELYKRCAMQLLTMDLSPTQAEQLRTALGSSAMQSVTEYAWALQSALHSVALLANEQSGTAHVHRLQRPDDAHLAVAAVVNAARLPVIR